jgi:hypothetical protein
MDIYSTLPAPAKHQNIPESAQWLSGEGAGSWFDLQKDDTDFIMNRYSADGKLECTGRFNSLQKETNTLLLFDFLQPFRFSYTSHCKQITLIQNNQNFIMWNVLYKR